MTYVEYINALDKSLTLYINMLKLNLDLIISPPPPNQKKKKKKLNRKNIGPLRKINRLKPDSLKGQVRLDEMI